MPDFKGREDMELLYNHCYILAPAKMGTVERCLYWDGVARQDIADLERTIGSLRAYRAQIAARAAELSTAPYTLRLSLTRTRKWDRESRKDRVFYRVRLTRVYLIDGIEPQDELNERFPGSERHKAKARFEELKKRYNGIETAVDIEKKSWER